MATRHAALAAFGAAVLGFAIYLLVQVNAAAAHVSAPDPADRVDHPAQVATVSPPAADPPPPPKPPSPPREGRAGPFKLDIHPHETATAAPAPALPPGAAAPGGGNGGSADKATLDGAMRDANKAYDGGDWDEARADAEKILAQQPGNTRMLRIVVSVACLDGDQTAAQKAYDLLPAADRTQMKTRCARSGVTFSDSTPPP
jgi:hypothetical protein